MAKRSLLSRCPSYYYLLTDYSVTFLFAQCIEFSKTRLYLCFNTHVVISIKHDTVKIRNNKFLSF